MPYRRPLLFLALLAFATCASAQTPAAAERALDDFSNYPLDEIISGKGDQSAWRARGVNLALSGRIFSADGKHVLGLPPRHYAIFDSPSAFSIPVASSGAVSFRIRLPLPGETKNDQAFYFIVKTRAQAESDLTNPINGLLLLQFSYVETDHAYRLRLEGPGPSPTTTLIAPGKWYDVSVRIDPGSATYQVFLAPPGGASALVTNHLYRDGVVPFKNRGSGPAEVLYLRNHNLPGHVELDALRFTPGEAASTASR